MRYRMRGAGGRRVSNVDSFLGHCSCPARSYFRISLAFSSHSSLYLWFEVVHISWRQMQRLEHNVMRSVGYLTSSASSPPNCSERLGRIVTGLDSWHPEGLLICLSFEHSGIHASYHLFAERTGWTCTISDFKTSQQNAKEQVMSPNCVSQWDIYVWKFDRSITYELSHRRTRGFFCFRPGQL